MTKRFGPALARDQIPLEVGRGEFFELSLVIATAAFTVLSFLTLQLRRSG